MPDRCPKCFTRAWDRPFIEALLANPLYNPKLNQSQAAKKEEPPK